MKLTEREIQVSGIRTQMSNLISQMREAISKGDRQKTKDTYETYQITRLVLIEDYGVDKDSLFFKDRRMLDLPWKDCGMQVPVIE